MNIPRIKGRNNKIIIVENGKTYINNWFKFPRGLKIRFRGDNNTIRLNLPIRFKKSLIRILSNDATVEIGEGCVLSNFLVFCGEGSGQLCKIGSGVTTESAEIILGNSAQVVIGDDCMFSFDVQVRATDSHYIYDKDTKQIINMQKQPLLIGEHCWIGKNVCITKNVQLPANTVVGIGSVVTGVYSDEEYTCIAGNPAKVIKKNITWSRELEVSGMPQP